MNVGRVGWGRDGIHQAGMEEARKKGGLHTARGLFLLVLVLRGRAAIGIVKVWLAVRIGCTVSWFLFLFFLGFGREEWGGGALPGSISGHLEDKVGLTRALYCACALQGCVTHPLVDPFYKVAPAPHSMLSSQVLFVATTRSALEPRHNVVLLAPIYNPLQQWIATVKATYYTVECFETKLWVPLLRIGGDQHYGAASILFSAWWVQG